MAQGALHHPTFSELTRVSARIGVLSFGGPAGQIALMHRELVDERRWVSEDDYLQALNLCHLLPGPEAQQLATWIGWKLHGWKGGFVAGALFVIPGALVMLALSMLYALAANLDWFAALFLFDAPFPLVVLTALALGAWVGAKRPDWLALKPAGPAGDGRPRPWRASVKAVLIWVAIWAAPMLAVLAFLGPDHVLWDIGVFFSQLAVVTVGGAYAVLAYMAQEAVSGFGWLSAGEMADGLGLAETTPGPLIMVTQFVGYLAAFRDPGPFSPLVAGVLGAVLTTWVTFAPCFLWIFAFAPWMDRLQRAPALKGGLAGVTAAVVGVIANLALWFALHVLFARVAVVEAGPLRLQSPELASFDWRAGVISVVALVLIFALKRGIITTLGVAAAMGLALGLLT